MTAIINNYLNGSSVASKSEFDIMQAWRKEAKSIATRAIEYAIENGLWSYE